MKKLMSIILALALLMGMTIEVMAAQTSPKGYLSLGQDLSGSQLQTVLSLFGISQDELSDYTVVYTTNEEEHRSLDKYIDSSVIGTKSLSSVLVKPSKKGSGVTVTTNNINYCTTNMYRNALITAGVADAEIIVAAPSPISGTAALIGALKAYEKMSGEDVSEKALDTSLNELVTSGEISESVGDDKKAEEFIAYLKTIVATNDLETREEIDAAIRKGMKDMNVTLTEKEINNTIELMLKLNAMGVDYSVLLDQADDIYAKYKDDIDAGTFDIGKINIEDVGLTEVIGKAVSSSFKKLGKDLSEFLSELF